MHVSVSEFRSRVSRLCSVSMLCLAPDPGKRDNLVELLFGSQHLANLRNVQGRSARKMKKCSVNNRIDLDVKDLNYQTVQRR